MRVNREEEKSREIAGGGEGRRARKRERDTEESHCQRNSLSKDLDARLDDKIERAQGKETPSPSAKEC